MSDGGFVIDTPSGIEHYRRQVMLSRMRLEMLGLKFKINTFVAARRELDLPPRTPRKKVLAAYEAYCKEEV